MSNPALSADREFAFSEDNFRFLTQWVGKNTGIVLADHKRDMVYSRLARRLRALQLDSFAAYCALIQSPEGEAEVGNLVNAITTNLTHFFREGHHFEHLLQVVQGIAAKPNSLKKLRLWSAGCSTGMEAYSIAMTLQEALPNIAQWDVKILATDIDTNVLETGQRGEYALSALEDVPVAYQKKYLEPVKAGASKGQVNEATRALVSFKRLNLLESWPMQGKFDVIFCRNVVIYFDKPTQRKMFGRMAALMQSKGWLYIGHSENLFNICDAFTLEGRTIYRKNT
jgi:chemotaxis protein methyltransferase CheR